MTPRPPRRGHLDPVREPSVADSTAEPAPLQSQAFRKVLQESADAFSYEAAVQYAPLADCRVHAAVLGGLTTPLQARAGIVNVNARAALTPEPPKLDAEPLAPRDLARTVIKAGAEVQRLNGLRQASRLELLGVVVPSPDDFSKTVPLPEGVAFERRVNASASAWLRWRHPLQMPERGAVDAALREVFATDSPERPALLQALGIAPASTDLAASRTLLALLQRLQPRTGSGEPAPIKAITTRAVEHLLEQVNAWAVRSSAQLAAPVELLPDWRAIAELHRFLGSASMPVPSRELAVHYHRWALAGSGSLMATRPRVGSALAARLAQSRRAQLACARQKNQLLEGIAHTVGGCREHADAGQAAEPSLRATHDRLMADCATSALEVMNAEHAAREDGQLFDDAVQHGLESLRVALRPSRSI